MPTRATGDEAGETRRNLALDNAKALVIGLVVVGHTIAPTRGIDAAGALYTWIYAFHMPAFVLVSGYLSRSWVPDERRLGRLVGTLLVPYAVFQVVHALLRTLVRGHEFSPDPFHPAWTLWFLLALAVWRLMTPLLRRLRPAVALGGAVVVSLVAGLSDVDQTLSAARVLGFLPFFVLGLLLRPEHLAALRRRPVRWAGAAVLAAGLVVAVVTHRRFPGAWLYYDRSYSALDLTAAEGLTVRAALLVAGALATLAVLAVVPARRTWWTYVGAATLYVYLLHPVVLYPLREQAIPHVAATAGTAGLAALVVGAALLALLLATRPVLRLTRPVVEPPVGRLLRGDG